MGSLSLIASSPEGLSESLKELPQDLPQPYRWSTYPLELDPWYNENGLNQVWARRVWALPSEQSQLAAVLKLSKEFPDHELELMFLAAARGKVKIVERLLDEGIKPTADDHHINGEFSAPLHAAAYRGHLSCVKLLIEKGKVNVDHPDDRGVTPLTSACVAGHTHVVKYLLRKGADITAKPQNIPASAEERAVFDYERNALDWAAAVGEIGCVNLIFANANDRNIEISTILTHNTLLAAACSSNLEALKLILRNCELPIPNQENQVQLAPISLRLTDSHKNSIEATICYALSRFRVTTLPFLCSYLTSLDPNTGLRNFTNLTRETCERFIDALRRMPLSSEPVVESAFSTICDLVLPPNASFTDPFIEDNKHEALNDGFLQACEEGNLSMLKLIRKRFSNIDPNYLSTKLRHRTSLSIAVGKGHAEIVRYLLRNFSDSIDLHVGNGQYCNGATALFIAIWVTEPEITLLLLKLGRGPVEHVYLNSQKPSGFGSGREGNSDSGVERSVGFIKKNRLVVTASFTYRLPVEVYTQETYEKNHQLLTEAQINNSEDAWKSDDAMRLVVLDITEKDSTWLTNLEIRRPDDELLLRERSGRELDDPCEPDFLVQSPHKPV